MKLMGKADLEAKFSIISVNLSANNCSNSLQALRQIAQYVSELETTVTLLQELRPIQSSNEKE